MQLVTGRRNCKCNLILHHLEQEAKDYWGCQVPKRIGFFLKNIRRIVFWDRKLVTNV